MDHTKKIINRYIENQNRSSKVGEGKTIDEAIESNRKIHYNEKGEIVSVDIVIEGEKKNK